MRIFKVVVFLVVAGFAALAGYAYFGDLRPEKTPVSEPVDLDAQ